MNVLLRRADHDRMMDEHREFLLQLFHNYARSWSLAGVTFYGVRQEDRDALNEALA